MLILQRTMNLEQVLIQILTSTPLMSHLSSLTFKSRLDLSEEWKTVLQRVTMFLVMRMLSLAQPVQVGDQWTVPSTVEISLEHKPLEKRLKKKTRTLKVLNQNQKIQTPTR